MPRTVSRPVPTNASTGRQTAARPVLPSRVDPRASKPFTLEQELEPFGSWVGDPIWVPPKDSSSSLADSMAQQKGWFTSKDQRWANLVNQHRDEFTQVREFNLYRSSIRLPKGRFFVSVTERKHFDRITDTIPACVQTRLDEFLEKHGKQHGVKVYYLKPLCVEVGNDLVFTTREDLMAAIDKVQREVFSNWRMLTLARLPRTVAYGVFNAGLALPRALVQACVRRRQREIDAYHAKLEFNRRKTALRAARVHRKCRTHGCSFDEMLALTNPLDRADVIEQYGIEHELSEFKKQQLISMAAGAVPWFVTLALTASYLSTLTFTLTPPVLVADPAFVAEMPGRKGELLKIGHFDEVDGVTHVEI